MFFTTKPQEPQQDVIAVAAGLKTFIESQGAGLSNQKSVAEMLSGESFETGTALQATASTVAEALKASGLKTMIMSRFGTEDENNACVASAMDHAAVILAAAGDAEGYHRAFTSQPMNETKATLLNRRVPGIDYANLSGETFEPVSIKDNLAISVVVAALSTSVNSFEQLFYPTVVLPAGKSGVDIKVRTPYAYQLKGRNTDGTKYDAKKDRRSLVEAYRDNSILRSLANKIIPNATAQNAGVLVNAADVPNRSETINGASFNTRPVAFGKTVDLIAISAVSELAGAGVQNQTDVLDANLNLGSIFVKLTDSDISPVSAVVELDVSTLPGANFFPSAEGPVTGQVLQFEGIVQVPSTMITVTNGTASDVTVTTGDWTLELNVNVTGKLDESDNATVYSQGAEVVRVLDGNGQALGSSEVASIVAALTVDLVGWLPDGTRTNSNLRERGQIIDAGTPVVYRIPVMPGAPLTAICPIGTNGEVDFDDLAKANRIRNSNNAVITTLDFERTISKTRDLPANSTTVGSAMGIKPTYAKATLDVSADLQRHSSMNGYADLRTGITNALSLMADQLAVESGYLSVLELESGSSDNYDVILGSDPHLASLIMTSGDARALGASHNFIVAKTHDEEMAGKIYVSFRRRDVSGPSPFSFGFHAEMPAMIYNAQLNIGGSTHQELQMIPRSTFAVTLPVLGVLEVKNMQKLFSTPEA